MSGKNQHYIPRFILRGFASKIRGDKVFTWFYRKGHEAVEVPTTSIFFEKHFYGTETDSEVDDQITSLERQYAMLLRQLRETADKTEVSCTQIVELVTHLSIRTKHMRESFQESLELLIDGTLEPFLDFEKIEKKTLENPEFLEQSMEPVFNAAQIPDELRAFILQLVRSQEVLFPDEVKEEVRQSFQQMISAQKGAVPIALKDSHIKALSESLVPMERMKLLSSLRWFVCDSSVPLILGDCGCLFEVTGSTRFKAINTADDELINVFSLSHPTKCF